MKTCINFINLNQQLLITLAIPQWALVATSKQQLFKVEKSLRAYGVLHNGVLYNGYLRLNVN